MRKSDISAFVSEFSHIVLLLVLLLLWSPLLILLVLCDCGIVATLLAKVVVLTSSSDVRHELIAEGCQSADLVYNIIR